MLFQTVSVVGSVFWIRTEKRACDYVTPGSSAIRKLSRNGLSRSDANYMKDNGGNAVRVTSLRDSLIPATLPSDYALG